MYNPQAGADLLDTAYQLESSGVGAGTGVQAGTKENAFKQWSAATNIDHTDPAEVRKVYEAVARMQTQRAEKDAKAAAATKLATARSARGHPPGGNVRRPKR